MSDLTLEGLCAIILGVMPDAAEDQPTPELERASDHLFEAFSLFMRAVKGYADEKIVANAMSDIEDL